MTDTESKNLPLRELGRFLMVAKTYQEENKGQVLMPACPVDTQWHELLDDNDEHKQFCHELIGHDIEHRPISGEGEIDWTGTYERLFGPLPKIWFKDSDGNLNDLRWKDYQETGIFRASWECEPYIVLN